VSDFTDRSFKVRDAFCEGQGEDLLLRDGLLARGDPVLDRGRDESGTPAHSPSSR
jgi:hypothetical protein